MHNRIVFPLHKGCVQKIVHNIIMFPLCKCSDSLCMVFASLLIQWKHNSQQNCDSVVHGGVKTDVWFYLMMCNRITLLWYIIKQNHTFIVYFFQKKLCNRSVTSLHIMYNRITLSLYIFSINYSCLQQLHVSNKNS